MEDSESVAASRLLPPSPNLETRQLQLLAAVTLLQGLPSTFLGRSSSRGGDVGREKVRWTILFFAATQIVAGALGEKGKAAKSKLATSPLLASADPLTSADFCEGEILWGQILYSQLFDLVNANVIKMHNYVIPKNNRVCVCFNFWQPSPRTPLVFNRSAWKKRVNRAS